MEFFLVLPLVVLVAVASIQVMRIAQTRFELQAAARDGARVAATTPDPSRAVDSVMAALAPEVRERARISVERPDRVGVPARVTVSLRHLLGVPFPAGFGVDLTASASMRTER
ncbi:MAG: pilus assembly protein [Actinomycetota bacterium]|nr:pilus assembly protein [Actinomycetota bacterium]